MICVTTPHGFRARGFWNDTGVSSYTVVRFTHKGGRDSQTLVSSGTMFEHGSIFTHGPVPWNPPKRYLVENVQKN
jgi:hypothetical protein